MTSLIVSESCTRANKRARGSAFPSLGRSGGLQLEACWDTLLRAWLLDFASVRQHLAVVLSKDRLLSIGLGPDVPAQATFAPLGRWVPELIRTLQMRFTTG